MAKLKDMLKSTWKAVKSHPKASLTVLAGTVVLATGAIAYGVERLHPDFSDKGTANSRRFSYVEEDGIGSSHRLQVKKGIDTYTIVDSEDTIPLNYASNDDVFEQARVEKVVLERQGRKPIELSIENLGDDTMYGEAATKFFEGTSPADIGSANKYFKAWRAYIRSDKRADDLKVLDAATEEFERSF